MKEFWLGVGTIGLIIVLFSLAGCDDGYYNFVPYYPPGADIGNGGGCPVPVEDEDVVVPTPSPFPSPTPDPDVSPTPTPEPDYSCGEFETYVCHVPPGNTSGEVTICIGDAAVEAHLNHGDSLGVCE